MSFRSIAINQFKYRKMEFPYILVDLRSSAEYSRGHLSQAVNLPYECWQDDPERLSSYRSTTLYLYCEFGNVSLLAARLLSAHGFHTVNLYGGFHSYRGRIEVPTNSNSREPASGKQTPGIPGKNGNPLDSACVSVYNTGNNTAPDKAPVSGRKGKI